MEARLKVALSENEKLKNENGTLKRQLEGLMNEVGPAILYRILCNFSSRHHHSGFEMKHQDVIEV